MLRNKIFDFPWGVVCGVSAMTAFYGTLAFLGIYVIMSGIAEQTSETVSAFENWYQTLIFVVDIIAALIAAVTLALYVTREKAYRRATLLPPADNDGATSRGQNG